MGCGGAADAATQRVPDVPATPARRRRRRRARTEQRAAVVAATGHARPALALVPHPSSATVARHPGARQGTGRGIRGQTAPVNPEQWKRWAVALTPPVLLPAVKRLARGRRPSAPPEWEYVPEGWSRARGDLRGWNDPSVLDAYRTKLDAYRATLTGSNPFAYCSAAELELGEPSAGEQNVALIFAYALLQASRGRTRVSVLDWGGGLGAYSALARAVLAAEVQ